MEDFVCDYKNCGKRFQKKSRLEYHKRGHLESKPFACEYEGCGAAYAWRQHLKRHVENIHSHPDKEFKCSHTNCLATFDTQKALVQHGNRCHHSEKSILKCSLCDEVFEHGWQLQEHEASHTNKTPFKCDVCQEEFDAFDLLKRHRKKHKDVPAKNQPKRIFNCKDCSEEFETFVAYRSHIKVHSESKRTCKTCNIVFNRKYHLLQHTLSAHSENRREYKCTVESCTRIYCHEKNLKQHIRLTHEGKSYPCELCGRSLSSKQKLKLHVEYHTSDPKPKKRKLNKQRTKEKLLKQLVKDDESKLDVDITTKKKSVIRNSHVSHILAAKKQFPVNCDDNLIYDNLDLNHSNEREVPLTEY
ncbi:unnamed protein product [Allacma fusca]|uniref:C2H2-type domain-containing protein n=1 Tax=Allacma fusca TaxID=39272 RepID=A0A8J2PTN0_9HEXA|nr:unnamed protein product [Allacma fusca]